MEHKAFIIYKSHCKIISKISNEKKGILLQKIIDYHETGEISDTDIQVDMAFEFMRVNFDIDRERYEKKCEILSENGKRGGLAKASKGKQKLANAKNQSGKLANHSNEVEEEDEEENIKETRNKEKYISILENEMNKFPLGSGRRRIYEFLIGHIDFIEHKIDEEEISKINRKLIEFREKMSDEKAGLEIESFCEYHKNEKTVFKSTIGRLNTWLSNKLK